MQKEDRSATKTRWDMLIIDKELREKFNDQCIKYQRPIVKLLAICECILMIFNIKYWINTYINQEAKHSAIYPWIRIHESVFTVSVGLSILIFFCKPKLASLILIILIVPVYITFFYTSIFGEECQDDKLLFEDQKKQYQKQYFDTLRIANLSNFIFVTFHPNWVIAYTFNTLLFYSCCVVSGIYHPGSTEKIGAVQKIYFMPFFFALIQLTFVCFIRHMCTQAFLLQKATEKSRDQMIKLFDQLPDSVLLIKQQEVGTNLQPSIQNHVSFLGTDDEQIKVGNIGVIHYDLLYCNEPAAKLYQIQFSQIKGDDLKLSQYRIMQNRCLRLITSQETEIKKIYHDTQTLVDLDFGSSYITLEEALQTFDIGKESELFELKSQNNQVENYEQGDKNSSQKFAMPSQSQQLENKNYIVKLRKQSVIIDGQERQIIIIRDFSDFIDKENMLMNQQENKFIDRQSKLEVNNMINAHCNLVNNVTQRLVSTQFENQAKDIQTSAQKLHLMFQQFKDLSDIRLDFFESKLQLTINSKDFLKNIKTDLDSQSVNKLQINIDPEIPNRLQGDFNRFNYLINLLFQNRYEQFVYQRKTSGLNQKNYVFKLKFFCTNELEYSAFDYEEMDISQEQYYLVFEIKDTALLMTKQDMIQLVKNRNLIHAVDNTPADLRNPNLSSLKIIAKQMKAKLIIKPLSGLGGTCFQFCLPVTVVNVQN